MIKCFRYFRFVISLVGWNCFGFERLWALYVTLQSLYPAYFTIRVPFLYGTTSLNSRNSLYCTSQFTISLKRVSLELRIRVSACKCMQLFKTDIRATINQKKIPPRFENFKIFQYFRPLLYTFLPLSIIHHRRTVDKEHTKIE